MILSKSIPITLLCTTLLLAPQFSTAAGTAASAKEKPPLLVPTTITLKRSSVVGERLSATTTTGDTINYNPEKFPYKVKPKDLITTDIIYAVRATKIDAKHSLLSISQNPAGPTGFFLVNDKTKKVIRRIANGYWLDVDGWYRTAKGQGVRVVVDSFGAVNDRVVLFDYAKNYSKVLYTEKDQTIQLAEICELGCYGTIQITANGSVLVKRYRSLPGTTQTMLVSTVEVPLPKAYQPVFK
jgi:hypothetical protein